MPGRLPKFLKGVNVFSANHIKLIVATAYDLSMADFDVVFAHGACNELTSMSSVSHRRFLHVVVRPRSQCSSAQTWLGALLSVERCRLLSTVVLTLSSMWSQVLSYAKPGYSPQSPYNADEDSGLCVCVPLFPIPTYVILTKDDVVTGGYTDFDTVPVSYLSSLMLQRYPIMGNKRFVFLEHGCSGLPIDRSLPQSVLVKRRVYGFPGTLHGAGDQSDSDRAFAQAQK
eukprot:5577169-Amphidinium_carterae.1